MTLFNTPVEFWHVAVVVCAVICIIIVVTAKIYFDDDDPDMFWYDNYMNAERPHVALKNHCDHTGDKTLVVDGDKSSVTIETVNTVCDDCGQILKTETECR